MLKSKTKNKIIIFETTKIINRVLVDCVFNFRRNEEERIKIP